MTIHAIGMRWAGARPSIVSADLTESHFVPGTEERARAETPTEVIQCPFDLRARSGP